MAVFKHHFFARVVLIITILVASPAFGQVDRAVVTGVISDTSDAVLAGTIVQVTNVMNGFVAKVSTNGSGLYYLSLTSGDYVLSATHPGFDTVEVKSIHLTVNQSATVNLRLSPASVQTQITVEEQSPLLEAQGAALGTTIESEKITQLPLLGRNPYSLVALAPAVTPKGNPGTGALINGGRSNTNSVLLDGQEELNSTTNDTNYTPPLESVEQFKVQTSSFSAEFGRTGGGVINVETRSGTNAFHGALYEFFRNNVLNANSYSNTLVGLSRPVLRRNEFGAALGGPVLLPKLYSGKDRTFFFVNWESVRERAPQSLVATVPTALQRAGDFSQTRAANGNLLTIYDPISSRADPSSPGNYLRSTFLDNRIPDIRIDPVVRRVLQYYPLPNAPGDAITGQRNFVQNGTTSNDINRILFRLDQMLGQRQRLFGRAGFEGTSSSSNIIQNLAFPRQTSTSIEPIAGLSSSSLIGDTVTFSPTVIAELRLGFTRNRRFSNPTSQNFDLSSLGFAPSVIANVRSALFPGFTIADATPLGPDTTALRLSVQENRQAQGVVTWVAGRHTMRFGGDIEIFRNNTYSPSSPAGTYSFDRGFTQGPNPARASTTSGNGIASFLLGLPVSGALTTDPSLATQQVYYSGFAQDTFRVLPSLTIDVGFRYEYTTPWKDRFNQLAYFDPASPDALTGKAGKLRFVDDGTPGQTDQNTNNFAPRVGLAWLINSKWVARAGYGLFFAQGNGGVGAVSSELGSGFQVSNPVFLGQPSTVPFRPPANAGLTNAFVNGFAQPPSMLVGGSLYTTLRNYQTPANHQWTASVQRQLSPNLLFELGYTGSRGQHLWQNVELDALNPFYLSLGSALLRQVNNPFYNQITTGPLSARTITVAQSLLPYPQYTSVTQFRGTIGDSIYHALTARLDKRFANGFTILGSFTWSKLIDNTGEHFASRTSVSNPYNLSADRSVADYNLPRRLSVAAVWELPFGPGKTRFNHGLFATIVGSWQLNGIYTLQDGLPIAITVPNVTNGNGLSSRANRLGSGQLDNGQTRNRWFNTANFLLPDPYTFGTDSRTEPDLRGPGLSNLDLSLNRNQVIRERFTIQLRGEAFNLLNTPQLDLPVSNLSSPDFGRIISGGNNRVFQLGLRCSF